MTLTLKPLPNHVDDALAELAKLDGGSVMAMPGITIENCTFSSGPDPAVDLHHAVTRTKAREESRQRARERARDAKGRFKAEQEPESTFLPWVGFAAACGVMVGVALVRILG
jgi:hypothetical protein